MGDWVSVGFMDRYNDSDTEQRNYWRVPYDGAPNIVATTCLSAYSGGIDLDNSVTGLALASFKRYEYFDESGTVQEVEITTPTNWLRSSASSRSPSPSTSPDPGPSSASQFIS